MSNTAKSVSVNDFLALTRGASKITVVDVRTSAEVSSERLADCINIPLQELSASKLNASLASAGRTGEEPIYLLCGTGLRAKKAAAQLKNATAHSLVVIEGGINALRQAGASLIQSARSLISLERQVRIAAGLLVVSGVISGALVTPLFYGLSAFVGAGLIFAGVTGSCGIGLVLARMPWNRKVI